jgi:hypothetical protein
MQRSIKTVIVPLLVAFIGAAGTVGGILLQNQTKKSPSVVTPSPISTPTVTYAPAKSECNQAVASKVCVANVTVQINSDEPQLLAYNQRIPLNAGDTLRVVNLHYCISPEATVNRVEGKTYLFKNGIESSKYGVLTPSSFPISSGCHNVGNFEKTWKVEPGQHRLSIQMIKHDGSTRIVDKSFYFNLDVGR